MVEIVKETRAKVGYFATKRIDKGGRLVDAKQDIVVSAGAFSTKEMEKEMLRIADDTGSDPNKIRIESYKHGEAPIEANPRHRGVGKSFSKHSDNIVETTEKPKHYAPKVWGGWEDPSNPKPFKHA